MYICGLASINDCNDEIKLVKLIIILYNKSNSKKYYISRTKLFGEGRFFLDWKGKRTFAKYLRYFRYFISIDISYS